MLLMAGSTVDVFSFDALARSGIEGKACIAGEQPSTSLLTREEVVAVVIVVSVNKGTNGQ